LLISNLFVLSIEVRDILTCSSRSGSYAGTLLVLNQDFPAMRSIYGNDPLYRQFSSNIDVNTGLDGETNTKYGNEEGYWADLAKSICYYVKNEKGLKMKTFLRKHRNPDAIFKKQIEPLFYADIKMIVKMIGAAMMIDGIIEMALKSNDHRWTVDSMRLARIILGGVLFFM